VLLGPNGAGKTTAIRVITGALEPDEGDVRTFGAEPARHGEEIRRRCGVVSAKPALYDRLTGWENLQYSAALYGLGPHPTARPRRGPGPRPHGSPASTLRTRRGAAPRRAGRPASRWPARCCTIPSCCCSTSPPRASIPNRPGPCSS